MANKPMTIKQLKKIKQIYTIKTKVEERPRRRVRRKKQFQGSQLFGSRTKGSLQRRQSLRSKCRKFRRRSRRKRIRKKKL